MTGLRFSTVELYKIYRRFFSQSFKMYRAQQAHTQTTALYRYVRTQAEFVALIVDQDLPARQKSEVMLDQMKSSREGRRSREGSSKPKKRPQTSRTEKAPASSRTERAPSTTRGFVDPASSAACSTSRIHWTPRNTHLLIVPSNFASVGKEHATVMRAAKLKKFSFQPKLSPEYNPPPPPRMRTKRDPSRKRAEIGHAEMRNRAMKMREEAEDLMKRAARKKKEQECLRISLGLMLSAKSEGLEWNEGIKQVIKEWGIGDKDKDKGKGKGVTKPEFRLLVRSSLFPDVHASECDRLFESMDTGGAGSLDAKELQAAFEEAQEAAEIWRDVPLAEDLTAEALLQRAEKAEEAADAYEEAETAEQEVQELKESYENRTDIQLGLLLVKRGVKPGVFANQHGEARGDHQGELSKQQFRVAVQKLGLKNHSIADIDSLFEASDADGGGYLDAMETKDMIQQLRKVAETLDHKITQKTYEVRRIKAIAKRATALANVPLPDKTAAETTYETRAQQKKRKKVKPKKKSATNAKDKNSQPGRASSPSSDLEDMVLAAVDAATSAAAAKAAAEEIALADKIEVQEAFALADKITTAEEFDDLDEQEDAFEALLTMDNALAARLADTLRRLQYLGLTRSFNTWRGRYEEIVRSLELMREAAIMFRIPEMMRLWNIWKDMVQARKTAADGALELLRLSAGRLATTLRNIQTRRSMDHAFTYWVDRWRNKLLLHSMKKKIRSQEVQKSFARWAVASGKNLEDDKKRQHSEHGTWLLHVPGPIGWLFGQTESKRSISPTGFG